MPTARRITPEASELVHKATCWIRSREVRDVLLIAGRGGHQSLRLVLQITGLKVKSDNAPMITLTQAAIPVPNLYPFSSETPRNITTGLAESCAVLSSEVVP